MVLVATPALLLISILLIVSWSDKKRFPDAMREPMMDLGRKAIQLRVLDDPLFDAMPKFIEYNRYTMKVSRRAG